MRPVLNVVCLIAALLILPSPIESQVISSGTKLVSSNQISVDNATRPHIESYIAVNATNPQHLLAAAMVVINGKSQSVPYVSFDGGKSWAAGKILDNPDLVTEADPIVYFSSSGVAFFACFATVKGLDRTMIARSVDGGRTWRVASILPPTDRPWMVMTPNRGPFAGRVYFTGTAVFRSREGTRATGALLIRSDDDGQTFGRNVIAYDRGGENPEAPINAIPLEPIIAPTGQLLLTLQSSDKATIDLLAPDSLTARTIGIITSDDGGESFGPARYAPRQLITITGGGIGRYRASAAFGNIRSAIDGSTGPFRNRAYFVAPDYARTLDRYVVRVWRTNDFGKTWGDVIASDSLKADVSNPAIAVNRDGVVAVTWNDRRDDPNGKCWQLYAAISVDGGEHFRPAQRLSKRPTCTHDAGNWQTFGSGGNWEERNGQYLAHIQTGAVVPARFPNGGDTQGLAADSAGLFHAAWISGETGVMQLWHTSFEVEPTLISELRVQTAPTSSGTQVEPPPAGFEDVTHDVVFQVTDTKLDFTAHTYTVTAAIENQSGRRIYGPVRAVMLRFLDPVDNGLGLKNISVANADSGGTGIGATWTFEVANGVLEAGSRSNERVLRFKFDGGIPPVAEGYLTLGFRVFGRLPKE
jgi:hypothetical protein